MAHNRLIFPKSRWLRSGLYALMMLFLLLVALRILAATSLGRGLVESQVDTLSISGQSVEIDGLQGDLLGTFSIASLSVSDAEGEWLVATGVTVDWSPMALWGRALVVTSLTADEIQAERRPILSSSSPSSSEGNGSFLSAYRVDTLTVDRLWLDEALAGAEVEAFLSVGIETTVQTGLLRIGLKPKTPSSDAIDGTLEWGGEIPLKGEFIAMGPENGIIANLLSPVERGPIKIEVSGNGTANDWASEAKIEIGDTTPARFSMVALNGTSQGEASFSLDAFSATRPFVPYLGSTAFVTMEQTDRVHIGLATGTIDAMLDAPWLSSQLRPDLSAINTRAILKQPLAIEEAGLQIDGATIEGIVGIDGGTITFDGDARLEGVSAQPGSAMRIEAPASLVFDPSLNTLTMSARVLTSQLEINVPALAAYIGDAPSLLINGVYDLNTRRAEVDDFALSLLTADIEAEGSLGADRRFIDVRGRLLPNALTPLPAGITLQESRFQITSRGQGDIQLKGDAFGRLVDPPHRLVQGDMIAALDATLNAQNAVTVESLTLVGDHLSAFASGLVSADAINAELIATTDRFDQNGLSVETSKLNLNLTGPWQRVEVIGDLSSAQTRYANTVIDDPRLDFAGVYTASGLAGQLQSRANFDERTMQIMADMALDGSAWHIDNLDVEFDAFSLEGSASGIAADDLRAKLTVLAPAETLEGVGALSGEIFLTSEAVEAAFTVEGMEARTASLETVTLIAKGPLAEVSGSLDLKGDVDLAGIARPLNVALPFELDVESLEARLSPSVVLAQTQIGTVEPIVVATTEAGVDVYGTLGLFGGLVELDGERGVDGLAFDVTASNIDAAALTALSGRPDLEGTLGAAVSLNGSGPSLNGSASLSLVSVSQTRSDAAEISGTLDLMLDDGDLQAVFDLTDSNGTVSLSGTAQLPVTATAAPFQFALPEAARLQSRFEGRGAIEPIWSLFGPLDTALDGQFELAASVNGPLDHLAPNGQLTLRKGRIEDAQVGLRLTDIELVADLDRDAVTVQRLSANGTRGGRMTGSGRYGFGGTSSVELALDRLDALQRSDVNAVVSGNLSLSDTESGAHLSGALDFRSAEINVDQLPNGGYKTLDVQFYTGDETPDQIESPETVPIGLDIALKADRRVRFVGGGLETEWRMDANLGGTVRTPTLTGSAELVRGDVDVLGRSFPLAGSTIQFNGAVEDAELALKAERTDDGFTAGFAVNGTVSSPEFVLTSTPQVPDDEVLSRALFGTSPSQLSALQAAQLAAGLAQLAGGGGPDLLGGLEDALDVDRIDLGFGDDGTASLGAGKYIADDIYLEVTTNTRGAPGLGVEWTPHKNIEIGAEFGTEVTPRFSIQWTRDYGGPEKLQAPEPEGPPSPDG
ncbi:MAG: translocation/assembly module TamB domain-containing protein [Pseudomonadota bacterium]